MTSCLLDARRTFDGHLAAAPQVDLELPLFIERALGSPAAGRRISGELISGQSFRRLAANALRGRDRFLEVVQAAAPVADGADSITQATIEDGRAALELFRGDDLLHQWREIMFGQALVDALADEGVERFVWQPGTAGAHRLLSELLLQAMVGGRPHGMSWQRLGNAAPTPPADGPWRRLDNAYRKVRNHLERQLTRRPGSGRCIAVFSTQQWRRFSSALEDLRQVYGSDLSFWYLGRLDAALKTHLKSLGVTASQLPMPPRVDGDLQRYFHHRYQQWCDHGRHLLADELACPTLASKELEAYFEHYFRFTFPRAGQWLRELQRALAENPPELVVSSAAFTFTSAMPMVAARRSGVPSLALSHTYISGDSSPIAADYLACRNPFERRGYASSFPNDDGVVSCRNACDTLSYQVQAAVAPSSTAGRRRVALLTAAPQLQLYAMPLHELRPCAETLDALCSPPPELDDIQWVFKFHPRFDITDYFDGRSLPDNVEVYPAHGSLHTLLDDCWLAVMVNHVGGVAIDAYGAGLPLLSLDSANYCYPKVDTATLQLETLASTDALWRKVRTLRDDPTSYDALLRHSHRFVAEQLPSAKRSLAQCLQKGLPEIIDPR